MSLTVCNDAFSQDSPSLGTKALDFLDRIHFINHFATDDISPVELVSRCHSDEKLGALDILLKRNHRQSSLVCRDRV